MAYGVICICCALLKFPNQLFGGVVDIICIFFYTYSPYFMCHCTEYKLSTLQVRISQENKLNATTQQFITAKISGCTLKQGSNAHSSLRQSNFQLQNKAALMSCRMRAVEHRCSALACAHPGLHDQILLQWEEKQEIKQSLSCKAVTVK